MSTITAWLQQHAQQLAEAATGVLWQLHEPQLLAQLVSLFACTSIADLPHQYLCHTQPNEIWHVHEVAGQAYAHSFTVAEAAPVARTSWLGELVIEQWFDHYRLEIYQSSHSTSSLKQAAKLRLAQRMRSLTEVTHGRYHAQLANPEASLLFIPAAKSNYSVLITTGAKRR